MPIFIYKAKDNSGRTIKDRINASNSQEALTKLRANFAMVFFLKEEAAGVTLSGKKRAGSKIPLDLLAQFSRELSTMVGTGTPLVRSLTILSKQFKDRTLAGIAKELSQSIEAGSSFAEGLSRHPQVFSPLYVNMVAAGETSGMLNDILEHLAIYLEKTSMLLRKIKTAMIYPAAVVTVALVIVSFLVLKVIPSFKSIFDSLGGGLPLPTLIVVNMSNISRKFFFPIVIILFVLGMLIYRYINTTGGRLIFDRLKLKTPIIGDIFQKVFLARFSRTLSTLLKGGVPILEALNIVSKSIGNSVMENAIIRAKEEVRHGKRLSVELEKEKYFPPMAVEMIAVGEETGELGKLLDKVAQGYEEQVDVAAAGLVSLIEPFIIIFLGIVVGGIVVAMFLPILKITQLIGG